MNLKQVCDANNLELRKALVVYGTLEYQDYGVLDLIKELDPEFEQYIDTICDVRNDWYIPKYVLEVDDVNWNIFKDRLKSLFYSNGHPDNLMSYAVININRETKDLFNYFNQEYDIDLIYNTVLKYYIEGERRKSLNNYMRDNMEMDISKPGLNSTPNIGFTR